MNCIQEQKKKNKIFKSDKNERFNALRYLTETKLNPSCV